MRKIELRAASLLRRGQQYDPSVLDILDDLLDLFCVGLGQRDGDDAARAQLDTIGQSRVGAEVASREGQELVPGGGRVLHLCIKEVT